MNDTKGVPFKIKTNRDSNFNSTSHIELENNFISICLEQVYINITSFSLAIGLLQGINNMNRCLYINPPWIQRNIHQTKFIENESYWFALSLPFKKRFENETIWIFVSWCFAKPTLQGIHLNIRFEIYVHMRLTRSLFQNYHFSRSWIPFLKVIY